jgi:hypothetical protein
MTNEQVDAIILTISEGFQQVADAIENSAISERRIYDIVYALEAIQNKLVDINQTMRDAQ